MSLALQKASGSIVVYVDDDTHWPSERVLPYLLAGFNDPSVGGVTGRQRYATWNNRYDSDTVIYNLS
jgi:hypothetical protein